MEEPLLSREYLIHRQHRDSKRTLLEDTELYDITNSNKWENDQVTKNFHPPILSTDLPRPTIDESNEVGKYEEDIEELEPTITATEEITSEIILEIDPELLKADKYLQELVEEFHPIMYLHPREKYRPCTVEYYLANCELYFEDKLLVKKGEVTSDIIGNIELLEEYKTNIHYNQNDNNYVAVKPLSSRDKGRGYNLRLCPLAREGFSIENLLSAPLYARVRDCNKDYYEITYITHYAFNGSYNVLGMELGAHDCDFEHITVRVCKQYRKVLYIWFGSHGYRDGYWRHASQCKFKSGTSHPIIFVADHSHAIYSKPGKIFRIFGFANDNTCNSIESGIEWFPNNIILLQPPSNPTFPKWTSYNGHWCINGISSPHNQSWWLREPITSNTWLRRCFFSFIPKFCGIHPEHWFYSKTLVPD